ncbi:MAG: cytochrome c peroxidase [Bacteroidia bacterium]|jgi:cytochrome c peroxidase
MKKNRTYLPKINHKSLIIMLLALCIVWIGCKDDDVKEDNVEWDQSPYTIEYGSFEAPPIAADNPLTIQGVKLGRMLFYEKMLSGDGSQACGSCHLQEFAFSDTATLSIGIRDKSGKRQAMATFNMAWNTNEFFWDGRSHLLRDQSLLPIQDELEMDETLENVESKLSSSKTYRDQFKRAFGSEEVTSEKMSKAMEQFMNSIVSYQSKYDRFLKDSTVFSVQEKRGLQLFMADYNPFFPNESGADCAHCHSSFNFENDLYMNNGLDAEADIKDQGRESVTKDPKDRGAFKVTSLRNIALTAPYMHDGRFKTLDEVIDHYNNDIKPSSSLDPALENTREKGLFLDAAKKADLKAFLQTLTDEELVKNPAFSDPF